MVSGTDDMVVVRPFLPLPEAIDVDERVLPVAREKRLRAKLA